MLTDFEGCSFPQNGFLTNNIHKPEIVFTRSRFIFSVSAKWFVSAETLFYQLAKVHFAYM